MSTNFTTSHNGAARHPAPNWQQPASSPDPQDSRREWTQDDLRHRIAAFLPSGAELPNLSLDDVALRMSAGQSSHGHAHRPPGVSQTQIEHAVACVLRCEPLRELLRLGVEGAINEFAPDMPMALYRRGYLLSSLLWSLAQTNYVAYGVVPDRESLKVQVIDAVCRQPIYEHVTEREVEEFFSQCFDLCGNVTIDAARQLVVEVMEEYLCTLPLSLVIRDWQMGGSVNDVAFDRADNIRTELKDFRGGHQRLRGRSVAELFATARPPEWHVHGLFVKAETGFFAGPPKAIKSGVAVDLAVSLALPYDGSSPMLFLNHFRCEPARHVLFFSVESGAWVVKERIRAVYASKSFGLPMGDRRNMEAQAAVPPIYNLTYYSDPPRLGLKQDQMVVRREIRQHRADIVIFDPFYLMALAGTNTEASNVFQMGEMIRAIENVCKEEGATPIFVHHFVKSMKIGATPNLRDMAFAGAAEMAAQWLLVNHRTEYDWAHGHCRLIMCGGGRAGQSGKWGLDIIEGQLADDFTGRSWEVAVMNEAEVRERDLEHGLGSRNGRPNTNTNTTADRIVEHMASLPRGTSLCMTPLNAAVGGRVDATRRSIALLINEGRLEEVAATIGARQRAAYRLSDAEWLVRQGEATAALGGQNNA